MITDQLPFDINEINKGTFIPVETLENIIGIESTHTGFRPKLLNLKNRIEKALRERGTYATFREKNRGLEILLDEEASSYNYQLFRCQLGTILGTHQRLLEVDTRNLSSDSRVEHQRRVEVSSFIVQGINDRVKSISTETPKSLPVPRFRDRVKTIN